MILCLSRTIKYYCFGQPITSIHDVISYSGSFRLSSDGFGASSVNYAVGTLAYNSDRHSLFIVGATRESAIAEFPIPDASLSEDLSELPVVEPIQDFVLFLDQLYTTDGINRITGMYVHGDEIIVNAENWYGAGGQDRDTTFVIKDKSDLINSAVEGYFQMEGAARCAGYMGAIPEEWRASFGGSSLYTGWSSVYSIISRYSIGPSLWAFDEGAILNIMEGGQEIPTRAFMNYPYAYDESTHLGDIDWSPQGTSGPFPPADPLVSSSLFVVAVDT